jgi:HAD superfamily hydrolase (TIGR01490 family)
MMSTPAPDIVLFDMDGTLVRKNTGRLYVQFEYDRGRMSLARVAEVATWHARYLTGYLDIDGLAERAIGWYQGRLMAEIEAEMEDWFQRYVAPHVSEAAKRCVASHLQRGDIVAIATGSTAYSTRPLARHLGIPDWICSEVELNDGRITGKLLRPACAGAGKVLRTQRWLDEKHPGSSLSRVTFYSDSITDLPLLEAVGNPVVVNPDVRLAWKAKERGWPVLRW